MVIALTPGLAQTFKDSKEGSGLLSDVKTEAAQLRHDADILRSFAHSNYSLETLSFWILGISAPVLWALVTGLASIVPFFGSALVWMPASIVLLLTGHWIKAIALLIWGQPP